MATSPFLNPDLMVIGDSISQGCRSLSVSQDYCAESYGACAAQLLGWPYRAPKHPRPVLFDVEAIAGDLIFRGLPVFFGSIGDNYAKWRADFSKARGEEFFDNLGVAGFTLEDTLGEAYQSNGMTPGFGTSDLADAWLAKTPELDLSQGMGLLSDLHQAVNARYVLNPSNDKSRRSWTQLDWVRARKPKNLIVHLGHNNGLYAIGSRGELDDWKRNWSGPAASAMKAYAAILARLAKDVPNTNVLVIGLPKIGAVSNLMPLGTSRLASDRDYFETYETQFPFKVRVPGEVVKQADREIAEVNTKIRSQVEAIPKLSFFSAYDFFAQLDTKNTGETPLRVGRYTIDNFYIDGDFRQLPSSTPRNPQYGWLFNRGGIQSIDGMHPSSVGYALLGFEVAGKLSGQPVTQAVRDKILKQVVADERLISQFPQGLDSVQRLLSKYSHANQTPAEQTFNDTIRAASHVSA